MAIGTSGVSVPQLGQSFDTNMYSTIQKPQQTTLAEMLGAAKTGLDIQKQKGTLQADIEKAKAESETAKSTSEIKGIEAARSHTSYMMSKAAPLLKNPKLTQKEIIENFTDINKNAPGGPNPQALAHTLSTLPKEDTPEANLSYVAGVVGTGLTNLEQYNQLLPASQSTQVGNAVVPIASGNRLAAAVPPGTQTGPGVAIGLGPTTELVAQPGDNSGYPPGTKYYKGAQGNVVVPASGQATGGGVTQNQMSMPQNQQPQAGGGVSTLSPQVAANLEIGNNLVNKSREQSGNAVRIESAANQAIQLSQVTDTGQGAQLWNNLKGNYVGMPEFDPAHPAANYQILGHVLTNETNLLAQNPAYGAGTMASHGGTGKQIEQAVQTAGKTDWNPEAIQYTSRYNRALAYGVQMFNHGVDQSQTISNNNPIYANDYQQKWNSNLNLDSIRLADGKRNAGIDPAGLTQITKELGGEKSERYKKAQEDLRVINGIATRGK